MNINFKLTKPLFISAFLFVLFDLCTCRLYAAIPINNAPGTGIDELATFEEDEKATFDDESAANVSGLLHAGHYQPSVYYPERQKQTVKTHPWMRLVPLALLVILSVGMSGFFKRRRQKRTIQYVERGCE